jgi:hypothetical protein
MSEKNISEFTDQELLDRSKKSKSDAIINAVFIGVMIGIIIYSIVQKSIGLVSIIPVYFIYKAFNNSKKNKEIEAEIKSRNLK